MYHRSFLIATLALDVGIEKKGKTMMQKKTTKREIESATLLRRKVRCIENGD
jgi:hypothetical protein